MHFKRCILPKASNSILSLALGMHAWRIGNGTSKVRNSENIEEERNANGNKALLLENRLKGNFVSKNVVNLSKRNLNDAEISLLSKGLNFVPTCNNIDKAKLKMELEAFGRMLRLKWH